MVYDTLFAPVAKGVFRPQMVAMRSVSEDHLTWRFTLRDGLRFHDAAPAWAADCIASLRRWAARSTLAGRLRQVGFTIDLQLLEWAALLARRTKKAGGSVFGIHALGLDLGSPLTNSAINFSCKNPASSGFICDPREVGLLDRFTREPDLDKRRAIAGEIQAIISGEGLVVPFGQFAQPAADRTALTGLIPSAVPLF